MAINCSKPLQRHLPKGLLCVHRKEVPSLQVDNIYSSVKAVEVGADCDEANPAEMRVHKNEERSCC